jgi:hypothetical protein
LDDENCAFESEKFWIEYFQSRKLGYNESPGGDGFPPGINHPLYGTHPSDETRKKLVEAAKHKVPRVGIKYSKEAKERISKRIKGNGNPMYGKHHSEETKKK